MANVVARGTVSSVSGNIVVINGPSITTDNPSTACYSPPMIAGEPIKPGDACHISLVDGQVYRSYGGGAAAYLAGGPVGADPVGYTTASLAQVDGYAMEQVFLAGEAVTLVDGLYWDWCNVAQTTGKQLFVSATVAGGLDDAASTGGTAYVGKVQGESPVATTSTKVWLKKSTY